MIGRTFSNYRVVSELGAGGMGVVYKALDLRLDRHVALKLLPADKSGDAERRLRFVQEARAASALNDPHIVTIYDIFTEDGTDVLVMEYVQGRTLREVISAGPIVPATALDIALQVAEGVGTAHAAGIVHRDLKPGNIMLTERGRVKVLDFGLAKLTRGVTDEQTTMLGPNTVDGTVLGTVDYMSPEQARGEAVDHRSDIFSLGCVLYELLTGVRPFRASHPLGVMHEILFGVVTPPRERRPEIGGDVDAIVMRALERDVARRYQSMEAIVSDLRAVSRVGVTSVVAGGTVAPPPLPSAVSAAGIASPPSGVSIPAVAASGREASSLAVPRRLARYARRRSVRFLPFVVAAMFAIPQTRGFVLGLLPGRGADRPETVAAPAMPATPYELTQQGLALLKRFDRPGNIEAAIQAFESAIASGPDYAPAHAAIAHAYVRRANETRDRTWRVRAVDAARQAVRLDQHLADGHVALGLALAYEGDYEVAEAALKHALELESGNGRAWFARGEIAYAQGHGDVAAAAYTKALELMPGDWESAIGVGNTFYRAGRYDRAVEWYGRGAIFAPDVPGPHILLGSAYGMAGDYADSAAALQKAITIRPTAAGYTNLGTALFLAGRYQESVAAFDKGVALQPANPLMWGNLGDAYRWTAGERPKAAEPYLRAIQLLEQQLKRSENVRDRSRLALYRAKRGDPVRAVAELTAILSLSKADVNTLYRAAIVYELAGNRAEALRWLGLALERGYSIRDAAADPELLDIRGDVAYQRLAARFDSQPEAGRNIGATSR